MKIGIITLHNEINYGASFQAVGLLDYVNDYPNIEAEFIDYSMNKPIAKAEGNKSVSFFSLISRKLRNANIYIYNRCKNKNFHEFWEDNYKLSTKSYYGDKDFLENPPKYDLYIAGSDQIFNLELTRRSLSYFLPIKNIKSISFSSSLGMKGVTSENIDELLPLLSGFDCLSIRELSAQKQLKSYGIESFVAADPVFLLTAELWKKKEKKLTVPKEYVFCYLMSNNPNMMHTIEWVKRTYNLPVIIVKSCKDKLSVNGKYIKTAGPGEFLYLISNASYVVTDSFHGCALGIIFGKKIFSLEKAKYIGDRRFEAIREYAKIQSKVVPHDTNWANFDFLSHMIDGQEAYRNLQEWIIDSKSYIDEAINRCLGIQRTTK